MTGTLIRSGFSDPNAAESCRLLKKRLCSGAINPATSNSLLARIATVIWEL